MDSEPQNTVLTAGTAHNSENHTSGIDEMDQLNPSLDGLDADHRNIKLTPGQFLDNRYRIDVEVGTGGYATIYRARHMALDRDVAIKVMKLTDNTDETYAERFIREAKIAAKLNHKNSVSIYDYGMIPDSRQPYIVMELLSGHDLYDEIYTIGPIGPKRAFKLFRPVLDALADGHKLGIVHKDLKPENLFINHPNTSSECMKVVDFGVARIEDSQLSRLTMNGEVTGTPRFLAPEYILSQTVSPAIDVYQMALIISESITGRPSVLGNPVVAMSCHCKGEIKMAEFLMRGKLRPVFLKAIAIDPKERYQNCAEFAEALDSVKDEFDRDVLINRNVGLVSMFEDSIEHLNTASLSDTSENAEFIPERTAQVISEHSAPSVKLSEAPTQSISAAANYGLTILFIAIIFLVLLILGLIVFLLNRNDTKNIADAPVVEPSHNEWIFSLGSSVEGVSVTDAETGKELCITPCRISLFNEDLPKITRFHKKGYYDQSIIITSQDYESTKGFYNLTMKVSNAPSIQVASKQTFDAWRIAGSLADRDEAEEKKPSRTVKVKNPKSSDAENNPNGFRNDSRVGSKLIIGY